MNGVADRSQDFYDGSEASRHPAFRPVEIDPYRKTSTLDNLMPTGNGMSQNDSQRALLGIRRSSIGQSTDTFDKSLWLRNQPESPALYNKTYSQ